MVRFSCYLVLVLTLVSGTSFAQTQRYAGVAFSTTGANAFSDLGKVNRTHLRRDLQQVRGLTSDIRTYTVNGTFAQVPVLAHRMGFRVTVGAWIDWSEDANAAEIARLVKVVRSNPRAIERVIAGNELVQVRGMGADRAIAELTRVKRALGKGVPVGTADVWSVWLAQPKLAAASDFIAAHILPYWDGVPIEGAAEYVFARVEDLKRAYPNKQIIIAETGWPSAGPRRGAAVPSVANQQKFIAEFTRLAATHNVPYFMFEAFDQPWKSVNNDPRWAEPMWGLFDVNGLPKAPVQTASVQR